MAVGNCLCGHSVWAKDVEEVRREMGEKLLVRGRRTESRGWSVVLKSALGEDLYEYEPRRLDDGKA